MKTFPWLSRVLVVLLCSASAAFAGSHTWSGATSGTWSDASNWSAGGAPGSGETGVVLLFPTAQSNMGAMNNDVANLAVTSITFSDTAYVLSGNGISLAGTVTEDGNGTLFAIAHVQVPIVLTADSAFVSTNGRFLSFSAQISGPFGITTSFAGGSFQGEVFLDTANIYTGVTTVASGYLMMGNAQALGAADGTAATGTVVAAGATLSIFGTVVNEALQIGGGGASGNGAFQNAGAADWQGPITLTSNASTNNLSGSLTLSGPIDEATPGLGINFQASAPVTLSGFNSYSGVDRLYGGTVFINGFQFSEFQTNFFGSGGGTLRGTGNVHGITAGGPTAVANAVAPGSDAATGILSSIFLTMNANSTLAIRINGPNPGTDYDQMSVTGPTALSGATLSVTIGGGYTAPDGTVFTIVSDMETINDVTGTFAGLPNGSVFTAGGQNFRINYGVGQGNSDITLTRVAGTPVSLSRFAAE